MNGADTPPSWRQALPPGERHEFWATPGWWDARDLRRDPEDRERLRMELLWALPPLPDGCSVLDVGAGTGNLVLLLARFYPNVRYILLDENAAALDRAQDKLRAAAPGVEATVIAELIDPDTSGTLVDTRCRLAVSTLALHHIVPPAAPDDALGREQHWTRHLSLLRRVWATLEPAGHFIYADAMRPCFRVVEHLDALRAAEFTEVDATYVSGRFLICGGQRP